MLLFLDDEREVRDVTWLSGYENYAGKVRVVRNFAAFVEALESLSEEDKADLWVSLDHDLADFHSKENCPYPQYLIMGRRGGELTGGSALQYLIDGIVEKRLPLGITVSVHSQNPIAAKNMRDKWDSFKAFALREGL